MPAVGVHELLHGRYQVLRRIGRGGMGAVYEAVDLRLHNSVAVKQMLASGVEADQAFEREARLLAALRHAALPVVIDAFTESGSRFLVMQYIEGEDLEARLHRLGPFSESEVTQWAMAVLDALVYLHTHEPPIVHRDIKPSNIKLTPRGDVVLLDFGLAKGRTDSPTSQIEDVSVFGFTPNYAPLEQLEARGTDPRSDLYALGATLYHLVTGTAPPSAGDRAGAIVSGRADPLVAAWPTSGVSPLFQAALTRALALDRAQRYPSARDMLMAFTSGQSPTPQASHTVRDTPTRRIDAAAPSLAEVGRPLDVIVQVRFADSPLLGVEDWPSRRRPDQIEQVSEDVHVEHAEDPRTGRKLPARLRVAIVAPDFEIRGAAAYVIDVPPDEYSKRLVFLLTPQRAGYCRVHVEVYTAADSVWLGTIPVETETVTGPVSAAAVRATELVLGVMAAPPQAIGTVDRHASDSQRPRHEDAERSRPPDLQPAGVPTSAAAITATSRVRLPRWAYSAATVAVVLTSVVVWRSAPVQTPVDMAPPTAAIPPAASPVTAPPDPVPAPAAVPPPAPTSPGQPRPTSPGSLGPPSAAPPSAATAQAPTPSPQRPLPQRPASALPIPTWHIGQSTQRSLGGGHAVITLTGIRRLDEVTIRIDLAVEQVSATAVRVAFDGVETFVTDEAGRRYPVSASADADAFVARTLTTPSQRLAFSVDVAIPASTVGPFALTIAPHTADRESVRFPPLGFRLPAR